MTVLFLLTVAVLILVGLKDNDRFDEVEYEEYDFFHKNEEKEENEG